MTSLIRLEEVTFLSEDFEVLKEVSVEIPEKKCTVILGSAGSGKSTFLKVAAGIYPPDRGRVMLGDKDLAGLSYKEMKEFRKNSGFVFQDSALWSNRTVFDNLSLPLEFHNRGIRREALTKQIFPLLEKFGFFDSRNLRPAQLSTGERKAVAFLRGIISKPEILFMDDPLQSMDREHGELVMNMLKNMKTESATLVVVTRNPELTSFLADHLILLKEGKVIEAGSFDEVKKSSLPDSRNLLHEILGEAASFDTDILDLLNG